MAETTDLTFLLQEYNAEIDNRGSLSFSCSYQVDGIAPDEVKAIEFYIIAFNEKTQVYSTTPTSTILSGDDNSFSDSCFFDFDEDNLPNSFQVQYRLFNLKKSFMTAPKIPSKKGNVEISVAPKSFVGRSKWAVSNFSVNSISVTNDDGDFNIEWFGVSEKQGGNLVRATAISGKNESDYHAVLRHPCITEQTYVNGSNNLSMRFDLFSAEKWCVLDSISDIEFIKIENSEDDEDDYTEFEEHESGEPINSDVIMRWRQDYEQEFDVESMSADVYSEDIIEMLSSIRMVSNYIIDKYTVVHEDHERDWTSGIEGYSFFVGKFADIAAEINGGDASTYSNDFEKLLEDESITAGDLLLAPSLSEDETKQLTFAYLSMMRGVKLSDGDVKKGVSLNEQEWIEEMKQTFHFLMEA